MKQVITLRASGLNTATSDLGQAVSPAGQGGTGQLKRAQNVEVSRAGLWQPRRGVGVAQTLVLGVNVALGYLTSFRSRIVLHASDGRLLVPSVDLTTYATAGTGLLPQPAPAEVPLPYGRTRSVEANRNLYLNPQGGVWRLESETGTAAPAGVPGGLDALAALVSGAGTAINASAQLAYRVLFGKRDANQNLLLGAPSGRATVVSDGSAHNVSVLSTIPAGVQDGSFFFRVYRSPNSVNSTTAASDEMALVYEAPVPLPVTASALVRATNMVTAATTTAHGYTVGQVVRVQPGGVAGGFAAVGSSAACATSPDGTTWTGRTIPAGGYNAVAGNGSILVAVGVNVAATSPDGITWTSRTIPAGTYRAVAWSGSTFVAVGAGVIAHSADGITWTAVLTGSVLSVGWYGIAWNGTSFLAVGDIGGSGKAALCGADGASWSAVYSVSGGAWRGVAWNGTAWCAVAASASATSTNGTTWASHIMPTGSYVGITWNGSLFVAVGTNVAATSADGSTWTARTIPSGAYAAATWNGLVFVVTGANVAATSPDGTAWTSRTIPAGGYAAVVSFGTLFLGGDKTITAVGDATHFSYAETGGNGTLTATQTVTPITVGVVDSVPDALVGEALYTNETQDGIEGSNDRPPDCLDMARFKNTTFFAAPLRPPTLDVHLLSTTASVGLTAGDVVTLPAGTLTAATTEDALAGTFKVFTAGDPGSNIANTVASLVRVINRRGSLGVIAVATSSGADLPGSFTLVSTSTLTPVSFSVSAHPSAWSPGQPTTVQPARDLNVLAFSKLDQPEAVPTFNSYPVGSADQQILRVIPLRDALFIMKEDGAWRLTGSSSADFAIQPLDLTVKLIAPETACPLSNSIIALTNQGVVQVTDTGVTVLSLDIEDQIAPLLAPGHADATRGLAFAIAYESERRYSLWYPENPDDTSNTACRTYHLFREAWTERDDLYGFGMVSAADNRMWFVSSDTASGVQQLFAERKTLDHTDFADGVISSTQTVVSVASDGVTLTLDATAALSVGDVLYQSSLASAWAVVIAKNDFVHTVTVDRAQGWIAGVANVITYHGIPCVLEWAPVFGDNPGMSHHWREASLLWHAGGFAAMSVDFTTDRDGAAQAVDVAPDAVGLPLPADAAGSSQSRAIRVGIPRGMQRGNQLHMTVNLIASWADWEIQGLSVIFEGVSPRVSRGKPA